MTVLLVEDDADSRLMARRALQQAGGFTVIEAASGPEALDALSAIRPDVVLLGAALPGMDGTEVLRLMRARPSVATVPVVLLTKPFHASTFPALIRDALDGGLGADITRMAGRNPVAVGVRDAADIDANVMQTLAETAAEPGGDAIGEWIDLFEASTREILQALREAADRPAHGEGADHAVRLAHTLKGSAATMGAVGIAELAGRVEALYGEGRSADVPPLLDAAAGALDSVLKRLRAVHPRARGE